MAGGSSAADAGRGRLRRDLPLFDALFDLIDGDLPLCAVAAVIFSSVGSVAPKEVLVEVSAKIKRIFSFFCAL